MAFHTEHADAPTAWDAFMVVSCGLQVTWRGGGRQISDSAEQVGMQL